MRQNPLVVSLYDTAKHHFDHGDMRHDKPGTLFAVVLKMIKQF